jgi:hypothetical protein
MPHITIRFINNPGFVSRAIAGITNSLFCHVEFGTPEGTWIGAHSPGGVMERPANYCAPSLNYIYDIPCSQGQADALLKYARAAIGCRYNYADIAGLLFHSRRLTSPSRVICSQFCTEALLSVGIRPLNVLREYAYLITPETLHLSPLLIGCRRK